MLPRRVIPFAYPTSLHPRNTQRLQTVVQIGRDRELLHLRARVISSAGYTVHSMTPDEAAAEVRKERGFQVWVFCHTLEFHELALLAAAIRTSWPADKLLRLTGLNDDGPMPGLFDELLEPVKSVDDLLRTIGHLAKRPA